MQLHSPWPCIAACNDESRIEIPKGGGNSGKEVEFTAARLASLVESSDDAIISNDLNSIVTTWNKGRRKFFGYTAEEMIGTPIVRLIPVGSAGDENHILGKIRNGENVEHIETPPANQGWTPDHALGYGLTQSRMPTETIIGASKIARTSITRQKEHERELARLTRLYAALSHVNQAAFIVWTPTREELFPKVCQALVEHGGFHMAWIEWHDPETRRLMPQCNLG